jgi:hypothetical protein
MAGATLLRRLAGVAAIVAAAAAVVLVVRGSSTYDAACGKVFDPRVWKQPESSERKGLGRGSERLAMAERLVRCGTLDGKRRAEVRSLLGRPAYPSQAADDRPCYDLGSQPEYGGLDNRVLCLSYGRAGRVERVRVATF